MRRVLIAALSAFVVACSGGGSSPTPPTTGNLRLVNQTTGPIHEVYAAPSNTTWGNRWNAEPIPSGSTFTLIDLDPGLWDVMVVVSGPASQYYAYGLERTVTAGATTDLYASNSGFTGTLKIYNEDFTNYFPIVNLYVVPVESSTWGDDQLGTSEIPPSWTFDLVDVPPGYYDVRCEFSDGWAEDAYSVLISSMSVTPVACGGLVAGWEDGVATWVIEQDVAAEGAPARRGEAEEEAKSRPDAETTRAAPTVEEDARVIRARYPRGAEGRGEPK